MVIQNACLRRSNALARYSCEVLIDKNLLWCIHILLWCHALSSFACCSSAYLKCCSSFGKFHEKIQQKKNSDVMSPSTNLQPRIFFVPKIFKIFLICESRIEIETNNRLLLHSYIKQILYWPQKKDFIFWVYRRSIDSIDTTERLQRMEDIHMLHHLQFMHYQGVNFLYFFCICKDKQFQKNSDVWWEGHTKNARE